MPELHGSEALAHLVSDMLHSSGDDHSFPGLHDSGRLAPAENAHALVLLLGLESQERAVAPHGIDHLNLLKLA